MGDGEGADRNGGKGGGRVARGSGNLASRMKRRRVNDRVVVPVSVVAGIAAAASGASPTGTTWSDWLLIVASVALVSWAGASTAWWVGAALAGLASAIAGDLALTAIGLAAFGVALWIGLQRRDLPVARAVVIGVGCNVLIRSELGGFLGLSTIIGVSAGAAIVAIGLRRRPAHIRRNVWIGIAATAGVLVLATAGAAVAAATSRSDLTAGNRLARNGLELLNNGDYLAAADQFDQAATAFDDADSTLSAPWATPAVLVPGLAQNLTAAQRLASSATDASADVSAALALVDPEQLRLVNGRIDIDAIRLIQEPFHDVQDSIGDLEAAIDDTASPWLIEPLQTRLDDLDAELADNGARLDNAVLAVDLAPQLLGADGPRRYFIAFTTPSGSPWPGRLHGQLGRAQRHRRPPASHRVRPHARPQPGRAAPARSPAPRTGSSSGAPTVSRRDRAARPNASHGRTSRSRPSSRRRRR